MAGELDAGECRAGVALWAALVSKGWEMADGAHPRTFVIREYWQHQRSQAIQESESTLGTKIAVLRPALGIKAYDNEFAI